MQAETSTTLSLFAQVVREHPQNTAVVFEDEQLTFEELDDLSNRIAHTLLNANVCAGERVGLSIERCPEAIAAMLGIFKIGAAFVPLDPEYPLDRIEHMVLDAGIRVIVADVLDSNPHKNLNHKNELIWVETNQLEKSFEQLEKPLAPAANDVAYIMYTSGSTGKPKGVQIEHEALLTYCLADIEVYKLKSTDRTLQFSTLNFDIAIEEIFPPLLIGSCVVIRPSERSLNANELSDMIDKYDVTAVHLATAYWHEWVDLMTMTGSSAPRSLRLVIATGEKVSTEHYKRWLALCDHDVLWCNAYGPTETTVTATVFIPDKDFDQADMPIGHPLPGYGAHILTDKLEPVEECNVTGQLFISGPALARGYLNRPDLTAGAFFDVILDGIPTRLYRTGDLARWLPDRSIEFAGRIDHQIKLGSYRIEPGEIEAKLNQYPNVLESLVVHESLETQKCLLAYIAVGKRNVDLEELADFLRSELPAYMVPARYVSVPNFPKTINGKVDRKALPPTSESKTVAHNSFVPPRDDFEKKLCDLWAGVLHVPRVGIEDDFFALGGSSLLVTRVVREIKETFDLELPVRDFFANPTVATSATHIKSMLGHAISSEEELKRHFSLRRSMQPLVEPEFIGCEGRELFVVHYQPRTINVNKQHAVLLCHAVGHEYTRAYRNLQQLALLLADQGMHVMRFDYFGTGNSNGECADFRLESMQTDIRRAAEHLIYKSDASEFSLVGIRLGATLAAMTEFPMPPTKLIAWDPVVDGRSFVHQLVQLNEYALLSETRYAHKRSAETEELFGHDWPKEKQTSLSQARLPRASELHAEQNLLVTSQAYWDDHAGLDLVAMDWQHVETEDEIYWQKPEFTESAFSSPNAFRVFSEFLNKGNSL